MHGYNYQWPRTADLVLYSWHSGECTYLLSSDFLWVVDQRKWQPFPLLGNFSAKDGPFFKADLLKYLLILPTNDQNCGKMVENFENKVTFPPKKIPLLGKQIQLRKASPKTYHFTENLGKGGPLVMHNCTTLHRGRYPPSSQIKQHDEHTALKMKLNTICPT